jgi:hypothetical protein
MYVLIPWYPISYLTIASSGFFEGGRLWVPTRRCDLVVPADGRAGGWGPKWLASDSFWKPVWEIMILVFLRTVGSANVWHYFQTVFSATDQTG